MPTNTLSPKKRKARTGYYSEITRDEAFGLSMDTHQPQKLRVYAILMHEARLTRHQISEKLDLPLHTVCARVNELMKEGFAIDVDKKIQNKSTKMPNNLVEAVVKEPELFPA